jgi:hypothetical protein
MNDELTQMEKVLLGEKAELSSALFELWQNVLEDVPREQMSKHLIRAIEAAELTLTELGCLENKEDV